MEPSLDWQSLRRDLDGLATELGFSAIGVGNVELSEDEAHLQRWLAEGRHGQMHYMERHGTRRSRPAELRPGTLCVISVRMDYWPADAAPAEDVLANATLGYISRYAVGRDYHKILRNKLQTLASSNVSVLSAIASTSTQDPYSRRHSHETRGSAGSANIPT
jgi:epoxyqueuosine reductase